MNYGFMQILVHAHFEMFKIASKFKLKIQGYIFDFSQLYIPATFIGRYCP